MAEFSAKERLIASMLSAMPGVKKVVKNAYVRLNALVYRKDYTRKVNLPGKELCFVDDTPGVETFFGYYDKCCARNGKVVYHRTTGQKTSRKPTAKQPVEIVLKDLNSGKETVIAKTYSYNWQQGARVHWLSDDEVIFNTLDGDKYVANIYSLSVGKIIRTLPKPVQDSHPSGKMLAINYERIMRLRPDYGYRNLPEISDAAMDDVDNDGIWLVDTTTGDSRLLHSLGHISSVSPKPLFDKCRHVANHLMFSPDGKGFIFIHRFYEGKRRHDRLMYFDFNTLRVLVDEDMVSHCHWIDNERIVGFLRYNGENAFWIINLKSGEIKKHEAMSALRQGDGHPTVSSTGMLAFDTYPDKSRMQHLYLMKSLEDTPVEIAELHHSVSYMGESRCDLHPRFSAEGDTLFFDTVCDGRRRLAYIKL